MEEFRTKISSAARSRACTQSWRAARRGREKWRKNRGSKFRPPARQTTRFTIWLKKTKIGVDLILLLHTRRDRSRASARSRRFRGRGDRSEGIRVHRDGATSGAVRGVPGTHPTSAASAPGGIANGNSAIGSSATSRLPTGRRVTSTYATGGSAIRKLSEQGLFDRRLNDWGLNDRRLCDRHACNRRIC